MSRDSCNGETKLIKDLDYSSSVGVKVVATPVSVSCTGGNSFEEVQSFHIIIVVMSVVKMVTTSTRNLFSGENNY